MGQDGMVKSWSHAMKHRETMFFVNDTTFLVGAFVDARYCNTPDTYVCPPHGRSIGAMKARGLGFGCLLRLKSCSCCNKWISFCFQFGSTVFNFFNIYWLLYISMILCYTGRPIDHIFINTCIRNCQKNGKFSALELVILISIINYYNIKFNITFMI